MISISVLSDIDFDDYDSGYSPLRLKGVVLVGGVWSGGRVVENEGVACSNFDLDIIPSVAVPETTHFTDKKGEQKLVNA